MFDRGRGAKNCDEALRSGAESLCPQSLYKYCRCTTCACLDNTVLIHVVPRVLPLNFAVVFCALPFSQINNALLPVIQADESKLQQLPELVQELRGGMLPVVWRLQLLSMSPWRVSGVPIPVQRMAVR